MPIDGGDLTNAPGAGCGGGGIMEFKGLVGPPKFNAGCGGGGGGRIGDIPLGHPGCCCEATMGAAGRMAGPVGLVIVGTRDG